ncbi:MAG: YraN family protein [Verrucomicrobia bacterium]|nr:YraN family protein [Verrucomicrobiota bacterium]|tara:strand:+ start:2243 stop:2605 length:363 start_codon:yes stop_codon:yes gene_type:complete
MAEHNEIGERGEHLAANYLIQSGYTILERNWRFHKSEIDIIAQYEHQLVIVEVKSRSSVLHQQPYEAVTRAKQSHLISATNAYIEEKECALDCRFDVISIVFDKRESSHSIKHIQEAFSP